MAPSLAPDPKAEQDGAPGSLADAAARLESALARLEALVDAGPLQSEFFRGREGGGNLSPPEDEGRGRLRAELDAARRRSSALEATAAAASEALGRAMVQVRDVLGADGDDADPQEPELDLALPTADDAAS